MTDYTMKTAEDSITAIEVESTLLDILSAVDNSKSSMACSDMHFERKVSLINPLADYLERGHYTEPGYIELDVSCSHMGHIFHLLALLAYEVQNPCCPRRLVLKKFCNAVMDCINDQVATISDMVHC